MMKGAEDPSRDPEDFDKQEVTLLPDSPSGEKR